MRRVKGALAARLGLLLLCGWPASAPAWGPLEHKVVARLAQQRLAPATRQALLALKAAGDAAPLRTHENDPAYRFVDRDLGRFFRIRALDLGLVANWADGRRHRDAATQAWHFVDLDVEAERSPDAQDVREACPQGQCVTGALRAQAARLADRGLSAQDRLQALFWVVHLAADLHQPLHCATRGDHGGNRTRVVYAGKSQSLHQVWDSALLERGHPTAARLQGELATGVSADEAYAWRQGGPEDWAVESWSMARDVAYGALPVGPQPWRLGRAYETRALPLARSQLQKAAVRLAALLDAALEPQNSQSDLFN